MNYKELNNAQKKISNWYSKKTRVLNIKTRPFNTPIVFSNIINTVLRDNGKILYVLCEVSNPNINRKEQEYISLLLQEEQKKNKENNIKVTSIDKITSINEEFDLVIFDDITNFSEVTVEKLREAVEDIYWKSRKIIIYSCEKAFPIGEKLELVYLEANTPVIEPRFITTRIKLEEDIPLALYDYLKWFKENKKITIILTPNEEKLNKVYNHYYKTLKLDGARVIKYTKGQNFTFIKDIIDNNEESLFIVTNNIGDYIKNIKNLNIVILFSDNTNFNYKKIIYLCSILNKKEDNLPEAILVSKDVTADMDKAKSIARGYNKRLWEKKLLRG